MPAGPTNADHFFVGTQDQNLRDDLVKIPGVPLLFVHATGVSMEIPTEAQRAAAARDPHPMSRPPPPPRAAEGQPCQERQGPARPAPPPQGAESAVPPHERHALGLEPNSGMEVHTSVRFKRNKAKGPNPLSAKKMRVAFPVE